MLAPMSANTAIHMVACPVNVSARKTALIPNANPTGVFTKITQRVPVHVSVGPDCTQVRPGAMATLKIRTTK